jgi:uncharacterized protein
METWTSEAILGFLHEHRSELKAMGVAKIGLFGSYVRGEQKPESDIDILVTIPTFTFRTYAKVWDFLEDHFRRKVDLVPEEDVRVELRPYIMAEVQYVEGL